MGADAQPDPLQIGGVCNCQLERSPAYVVAAQGGGSPRTVASRVYRTDVRAIPGSARRGHCNDGAASVSRILWSVRGLMRGHPSSYHRFFSHARWSLWPLGKVLAALVLELVPEDQPVLVLVDDTVDGHEGDHVFGKGCHRDAVRSSWTRTVFKFGHKWVTLAVSVRLPLCVRDWALPVLAALYVALPKQQSAAEDPADAAQTPGGNADAKDKSKKGARKKRTKSGGGKMQRLLPELRKRNAAGVLEKRHKTPALLARQMLAVLMHWFPDRRFILLGDWGFASHDLALFCHRHRRRVKLVARTRADMNLYALPPKTKRPGPGRLARKGRKLPTPAQTVAATSSRRQATVRWYGNSVRDVQLLGACGGWYRHRGSDRAALVPVRWVYVHDPRSGREDFFYSTDPALCPQQIVELFAARWAIEVTFQEVRAHLGFETTRHRCRNSVLRVAPCILGLFSVVGLIYARLARHKKVTIHATPCYAKTDPTFADALAA